MTLVNTILDDFILRAVLAGLGLALATAPLGCFVVWRRMAYFGDATAQAAILGVALSLTFSVSVFLGVLAVALAMALTVSSLSGRGFAMDTMLGVLAHSALAFGLVAASFLSGIRIDLMAYLFGDILAVMPDDLAVIWGGAVLVLGLVGWRWSGLLTATLNPDLARAEGVDPRREQLVLTLALAITVAVAIKVVGALLITAMLIIPAATARPFSRTPEVMAGLAVLIAGGSVIGGIEASYYFDTPTGPTIVCVVAILFALSVSTAGLWRRR
ncbi:metal ABC transporter permease [Pseudooceanicola aestuarii]|uniref:metal ABC transporter permease n=1 Tax=Pseudooceanicola aestuarii TaxID=2697319 RepID=UPI0013D88BD5|nr:metal ABC transporter permease [Pseudooceanicola aestuarii]